MSKLHLQLLASKWTLLLERHQMELDEMRREMAEAFGQENACGNDPVPLNAAQVRQMFAAIDESKHR